MVGARSALFLPFPDLGLIVVDEEHDGSFKQEEGVIYHARDMAVVRARLAAAPVVLASATPSLESVRQRRRPAATARCICRRATAAQQLPRLIARSTCGATAAERGRWLSPPLVEAMKRDAGGAASRRCCSSTAAAMRRSRSAAPAAIGIECPQLHRLAGRASLPPPLHLPSLRLCRAAGRRPARHCGADDQFVACGPGVERAGRGGARALSRGAAGARHLRHDLMSRDEAAAAVERMIAGEIDILIGTQIVAKGHHFPNLTLVGVVDADLGLDGGDLRAAERTFQLLYQVAGRAGRDGPAGPGAAPDPRCPSIR